MDQQPTTSISKGKKVENQARNMELRNLDKISSPSPSVELERGKWGSKSEFILSCMGYAIGISNVLRFPYLAYRNGGGAFLVPFLLMLVFCGIPLFFMETVLGQFSSSGCITLFRICPLFRGTGYAIIIVNLFCLAYYNVMLSYPLYFIVMTMQKTLPWSNCHNPWNTDSCHDLEKKAFSNESRMLKTPADEFFHNRILEISGGITHMDGLVWQLVLCDIVSWIIIFACVCKGVRSVGKVVYFTATFPYVILFALLIRGLTLDGAMDGIRYFVIPEWKKLGQAHVWADAAIQMFFGLGPGWGGIVNMSSFNQFRNNSKWDSILVPVINVSTSILSGFVVFSVLGYMANKTGIDVGKVAVGGPGLAFITYPEAISMMPVPHLWAILFFFMLYLLGMDSLFVQIEAVVSGIIDDFPSLRPRKTMVTFLTCFMSFLVSLFCVTRGGMYVLQLFDWYSAAITVILICTVEIVIVAWIYGIDAFIRDLEFMIEQKVHWWWRISWQYIAPAILVFIFITAIAFNTNVTYNGVAYPSWTIAIGWVMASSSMVCIPGYMIYKLLVTPGTLKERFKTSSAPSAKWGPAQEDHRIAWEILKAEGKSNASV